MRDECKVAWDCNIGDDSKYDVQGHNKYLPTNRDIDTYLSYTTLHISL